MNSPRASSATSEGTRLEPSSPGITTGESPSMYATREFVVPRSMPTMFLVDMLFSCWLLAAGASVFGSWYLVFEHPDGRQSFTLIGLNTKYQLPITNYL